ncbi:MAG: endonuclease III [Phycisphaerales bacterium]
MAKKKKKPAGSGVNPALKRRAAKVYTQLEKLYPDAHCALDHKSPFQLLVATILSAQCTDVRVNIVTPALFKAYPTPKKMAAAKISHLEELVKTTGFFRNKAKNIQGAALAIEQDHGGEVPDTMEELLKLPGVARKTANVVLGNAFDKNIGVVVDTHVGRLSVRLGWTSETDPKKVERDLMALFPQKNWTMLSHLLIHHGRGPCKRATPSAMTQVLLKSCPQIGVDDWVKPQDFGG